MLIHILVGLIVSGPGPNLATNPAFTDLGADGRTPLGYTLTGNATASYGGYQDEFAGSAVALDSFGGGSGSVSQLVPVDRSKGKWVTFRIRGRAEDGFKVQNDALWLQLDFYSANGTKYQDTARRLIYHEILNDRKDFAVNGDDHRNGAAVWRSYDFEELLPFTETDAVKATVAFKEGDGASRGYSRFTVTDFSVRQSDTSATGKVDPADAQSAKPPTPLSTDGMIALGGRWYYMPTPDEHLSLNANGGLAQTLRITDDNADRLFYKDDRLEDPFAGNMTAWLRKGYLDQNGRLVQHDTFVPDNVTIIFDGSDFYTVQTRNIPNHPTAKFPDTYGSQGYNPNYIQERLRSYRLPINPQPNPNAVAMTPTNSNMGLNMGSIGFAVNGVSFYNPFDAGMQDASGIMDRCCGHPSPDNRYHYHKYPICVNTPFVDKGEAHSPLIGFAFDGFPIYGPYESKGVMAKDLTENPLNAFNMHYDAAHGWHYHVTPGKFPYIIGGYFGTLVRSDIDQRGPEDGGRGRNQGPPRGR
jgi:hypothetical protein